MIFTLDSAHTQNFGFSTFGFKRINWKARIYMIEKRLDLLDLIKF